MSICISAALTIQMAIRWWDYLCRKSAFHFWLWELLEQFPLTWWIFMPHFVESHP